MIFKRHLVAIFIILMACNSVEVPTEKYYQFYTNARTYFKNDTIYFFLNDPVQCPLRYYISSTDTVLDRKLKNFQPITLQPQKDTILKILADSSLIKTLSYPNILGDLNRTIIISKISLPFLSGKTYKIIQGYNGEHSHSMNDFSRYAIDFGLSLNDTICAADSGVVVGVIKDYKFGGDDKRLLPHANLVTLYHPHSGLFTQYSHLVFNGSLVKLGDKVEMGEPIALAGETGFTDVEHLHFNVLSPVPNDLISMKISFLEGYLGENLKRGDKVRK